VPILSHSKPWQKSACPEEIIGKGIKSPFYHPEAEWLLIIYTVSLQSAAGTLIWGLLWLSFWRIESEAFYMVTFVLGVVGILGATRHLASPLRAPRAILNWRSSRLSRENILTSVFLGLVLLAGGVDLLPLIIDQEMTILPLAGNAIRILAGLTGVTLVGAMSMIYLVPTRPVWNHCDTLFSFYTGAFQIGWAISAAIMVVRSPLLEQGTIVLIAAGLVLLTLLRLKVVSIVIDRLSGLNLYQDQPCSWLNNGIRRTRIILALAGGIAAPLTGAIVAFLPWTIGGTITQWIWILAVLFLIIGEGIDRWVFYKASPAVIFPPRF
jgi:DMSO reductase anchor subunit